MRPTAFVAATGFAAATSARAIPSQSQGKAVLINGTDVAEPSTSTVQRRANSLGLTRGARIDSAIHARTPDDTIVVNMTRSSAQDPRRKSRSASLASTASGEATAMHNLVRRKNNNGYSNGDGRYVRDDKCAETGIWDTSKGRCKTKQDDIDAAIKAKKEDRTNKIGIIATASICGPIVLGGAGYGLYRCFRRR